MLNTETVVMRMTSQLFQHSTESRDSIQETSLVNDSSRLLFIVERLIAEIEKIGLFTVGIYRKPGPAVKIKKLLFTLNTTAGVELTLMPRMFHVIGGVAYAKFSN